MTLFGMYGANVICCVDGWQCDVAIVG